MKRVFRAGALLFLVIPSLSACSMVRGRSAAPRQPSLAGESLPEGEAPRTGSDHITSGVVETALAAIGTPYMWGGTGENGFDCSGLIQFAYGEFGIALPRISTDQLRTGMEIEPRISALREGDLLGFSGEQGGKTTHVGLYVGDGEFIHSSSRGVTVSHLATPYWQQHFITARRVVWYKGDGPARRR